MRAFIFTGGEICPESVTARPTEEDLTVAADSGYQNAKALGIEVAYLIGDFDSFEGGDPEHSVPPSTEVIRVPAEKDATDTQLAVSLALEKGATELCIIGGLSGRLDHTLSNLSLLESLEKSRIRATLTDGQNRIRFIRSTSEIIIRSQYKYLSLIAVDETVKGVSVEGCKYPLKNAKLERSFQYAVSNEITGNCALVSVKKGGIYIIESKDRPHGA